jgi:hypothetical protein
MEFRWNSVALGARSRTQPTAEEVIHRDAQGRRDGRECRTDATKLIGGAKGDGPGRMRWMVLHDIARETTVRFGAWRCPSAAVPSHPWRAPGAAALVLTVGRAGWAEVFQRRNNRRNLNETEPG